jgi:hypothetical protein
MNKNQPVCLFDETNPILRWQVLVAAGMTASFALAKVGIITDRGGGPQQPEPHGYIALRASRELVTLEQGSLMVGPVVLVQHQIEPRLRNVVSGLKDLLSHVPLTVGEPRLL